jgi:sugar phosphate isomerase/epimerase
MWAQQERFQDLGYFRDYIAAFGYDAIEVSHVTESPGLHALLTEHVVPLSSLHAPTPHRFMADGRHNSEANLASTDPEQTRVALEETRLTIDYAADAGLRYVVVHLGGVGDDRSDEERAVRRLFEQGITSGEEWDHARRRLAETRAAGIDVHMEVARASLEQLVDYASRRGVAIGIESRLNYHEIPHPHEAEELLAPYTNAEAASGTTSVIARCSRGWAWSTTLPGTRRSAAESSAPTCTTSEASLTTAAPATAHWTGP